MATYVTLGKYTAQGIKNAKDSPGRLDAAREQLGGMGVEIKEFFLTMGEYDIVAVIEAPDHSTAAKALIALGSQGNVSTTTMAALTEAEFRTVMSEM